MEEAEADDMDNIFSDGVAAIARDDIVETRDVPFSLVSSVEEVATMSSRPIPF